FYGRPALLYSINSKGAQAYFELATEIISRESAADGFNEISESSYKQNPHTSHTDSNDVTGV
ncbi:MAG: hypothetical protein WAO19_07575, partial [Candidatus Kryptoniota bacterium]